MAEQWDENRKQIQYLFREVGKLKTQVELLTSKELPTLDRLSFMTSENFEQHLPHLTHLRGDEIRGLRILQNLEKCKEIVYLPRFSSVSKKQIFDESLAMPVIRTGTPRLKQVLSRLEGKEVHSTYVARAMRAAALMSDCDAPRIKDLATYMHHYKIVGREYTFLRNRRLNTLPRTSKENFISNQIEYLLVRTEDFQNEHFAELFAEPVDDIGDTVTQ
jgi:hypothetical protein